jgi:hypothetical protein
MREGEMADQPTCGQGLAAHAAVPTALAALVTATAENLEAHMPTLDLADPAAAREHAVYEQLAADHRSLAAQLRALGDAMAAQRDLPMGRHDMEALAAPEVAGAFERLVGVEAELVALLQRQVEQHRAMLDSAARPGA